MRLDAAVAKYYATRDSSSLLAGVVSLVDTAIPSVIRPLDDHECRHCHIWPPGHRTALRANIPGVDELLGFSAEQASKLTGLSSRQLRYWDDTEFFTPALREDMDRGPWSRVYSFRDIVGLRAIGQMRNEHRIPLQQLRRVGAKLRKHYAEPWSRLIFYIVGRQVFFRDAREEAIQRADRTRQQVLPFQLKKVESDVRHQLAGMRRRADDRVGQITRNRQVAENQMVIEGTRIPTSAIWEFHNAGRTTAEILRIYPQLREADVDVALRHEARSARARQYKTRPKKAS